MSKEEKNIIKPKEEMLAETKSSNKKAKKRGSTLLRLTLGALVILLIMSLFGDKARLNSWFSYFGNKPLITSQKEINPNREAPIVIPPTAQAEEDAVVQVVDKFSPAVVSIVISKDMPKIEQFYGPTDPFGGDPFGGLFNQFFQQQQQQPKIGSGGTQKVEIGGGSGFVVNEDGLIVTNRHVLEDPQADYTVVTNDGREYDAKILGRDRNNDVAVLKIDPKTPKKGQGMAKMAIVALGDSSQIKIGQTVIAIGNALGEFRNTVSKGIVSGLSRNITAGSLRGAEQLDQLIQTDAAINQGNSGGPLLNLKGEVIGINVAMAQGAQNIGFTIPINSVKNTIQSVEKTGKIVQPYLGVRYMPINADIQEKNNLPFDYGALVTRGQDPTNLAVIPGSPADKAGIVENDIILEANGVKIDEKNPLTRTIGGLEVGKEVELKIWRKGDTITVKTILQEAPSK